jgi:SIR2-like protein
VCAVFEQECGLGDLRAEVAKIVSAGRPTSTPELESITRCPSRVILTANYDMSIETAVEATGRTPVTFWLDRAAAWALTADGEVHVVHVHGLASDPDTLVLPGSSTEALENDDRFKTVLRALVAPHPILYFGYAVGATETHLRAGLECLGAL